MDSWMGLAPNLCYWIAVESLKKALVPVWSVKLSNDELFKRGDDSRTEAPVRNLKPMLPYEENFSK